MSAPTRIAVDERTFVMVLTGAGVSAESGLSTFRDAGGLWNSHPLEAVATRQGFRDDPELVWRFYSERRAQAIDASPNPGHLALAALEQRLGARFLLVTQNVDGLHTRAGSRRLIEIHGGLLESRCAHCDRAPFADRLMYGADHVPLCDECQARGRMGLLRPNVVWFGEELDVRHFAAIESFLQSAERGRLVFVAAGTSGVVYPAAALVDRARELGAETWLVNAEPAENAARFDYFVQGRAGEILPTLFT